MCGAGRVYYFVKSCPMVRLLYAACRDVAMPMVAGVDVGRWVSDEPIIALSNPTGIWWGLHWLWPSRCQATVRGMDVGTLALVMSWGGGCAGAGATRTGTSPHDIVRTELCTCALPGEERQGGHRPEIAEMHTSKTHRHMVGTTLAVAFKVPSNSAGYGCGHPSPCDVMGGYLFRRQGVVHGATGPK